MRAKVANAGAHSRTFAAIRKRTPRALRRPERHEGRLNRASVPLAGHLGGRSRKRQHHAPQSQHESTKDLVSCLFNGREDTVISNLDLCDGRLRYARGATAHLRPRHPSVRDDTDSAVAHRGTAPLDARDVTSRRPCPSRDSRRFAPRRDVCEGGNIVHEPVSRSFGPARVVCDRRGRAALDYRGEKPAGRRSSLGTIGHLPK